MQDYISIDVQSKLGQADIYYCLSQAFSGFKWRSGDSDAMGLYVSGQSDEGANIQIWLSESPFEMAISFRGLPHDMVGRDKFKETIMEKFKAEVLPTLGQLVKLQES